jgi:AcrR family transcriptional regulator
MSRLPNVPPRPTRRTRAKYGGTKPTVEARLLAATETLLSQGNSFATLSVEQLAAEAGMARGTFYLHFRDKGELVARLLDQLTHEMVRSFGVWGENAEFATRKDVQAAVNGMISTFRKHHVIVATVRDTMVSDKNVAALYGQMVEKIAFIAQRSISTVKRRGLSRPGATDDVAALLAWNIALFCTHCLDVRDDAGFRKLSKSFGYICNSVIFADGADG